jgi:peroxiredoxin (alkyl hydroperoxide reductase subunit C)
MKKLLLIFVVAFSVTQMWSQEIRYIKVPLVGEAAPSFTASSTNGKINFPVDYGRKWKMLFSHPQDFTPVCSTELLELAYAQSEFEKLNVALIVISTDPLDQHVQWKKAMEEINYQGRGPVKLKFPLIDDDKLVVSRQYGMIHPASNTTKDVRGVFIIDPDDVIQAIFFYPNNVGRNIEELKRTVVALQTAKTNTVLTPANWVKGKDVLLPLKPETEKQKAGTTDVTWFMTFKKTE